MADILRELHGIQDWALENSIYTFEVTTRVYPLDDEGDGPEGLIRDYGDTEERFLDVTIFKTGDDSDGDYLRISFGQDESEIDYKIRLIKLFIGEE